MADIFLYPGEANPNDLKLRNPTIPDSGETITVDKWYRQYENPIRGVAVTALLVGSFFFIDAPAEVITVDKWAPPTNQPYVPKRRDVNTGEARFELPRTILLSDWQQPISQPYFFKRRDSAFGEFRFELPRTILISDWLSGFVELPKGRPRQLLGGESRTDVVVAVETITVDKWYQPIQQPYFSQRRDSNTGEFRFELPRPILITDWFQAISEPVKRKLIQLLGGESRVDVIIAPEVITIDKWIQQTSQPSFKQFSQVVSGEIRVDIIIPDSPIVQQSGGDAEPYIIIDGGGHKHRHDAAVKIHKQALSEDEEIMELLKVWLRWQ